MLTNKQITLRALAFPPKNTRILPKNNINFQGFKNYFVPHLKNGGGAVVNF